MKAFYIFSFWNSDDLEYDWFVGEDKEDYQEQEKLCREYMIANDYAENNKEAIENLESVYKQDTKVLIKQLKGE